MHRSKRIFSFFLAAVLLSCSLTVNAQESTKTTKGSVVKELTFSTDDTVDALEKQKNDYFQRQLK